MCAIARPLRSEESQEFGRFLGAETGTVFGTVSFLKLEPLTHDGEKTLVKSMVGVTGFDLRLLRPEGFTLLQKTPFLLRRRSPVK